MAPRVALLLASIFVPFGASGGTVSFAMPVSKSLRGCVRGSRRTVPDARATFRTAGAFLLGVQLILCLPAAAAEPEPAAAEEPGRLEIIKETQNPLTRALASVTASNEFSFGLGPNDGFGYGLLIKPNVPIALSDDWSLINRSLLPVYDVPSPRPGESRIAGLGDIQHSVLVSPATTRNLVWGLGTTVSFPSATDDLLGTGKWLMGPVALIVATPRRSVFGALVQNLWSVGGDATRPDVNLMLMRVLATVNLPNGWFITSKPNIIADWLAEPDQRWLVAAGGGAGKVFRLGRLGVSLEAEFFGYPVKPDAGPSWTARIEAKLLVRRGAVREKIRERRK